ncbi:MAG: helix-turn-helix transcriptional regulator [Spirochaetales bacterium]|nr:helix-turn-helix transcriptional regulator [Spirochaetales bacterium]
MLNNTRRQYVFALETQGFSAYLQSLRMGKARTLLKNPLLKISEIATMVGYDNVKYFTQLFKKDTGRTPGEYRDKPG